MKLPEGINVDPEIMMGLYAQTLENSVKVDFRLPQSGAALVC